MAQRARSLSMYFGIKDEANIDDMKKTVYDAELRVSFEEANKLR